MSSFRLLLPLIQVVIHSLGFIMSHTDIPYSCPTATTLFVRNRCFWGINERNNFNQSQRRCRDNGGTLGEIPDHHVEEAVVKMFGDNWRWIGVRKRQEDTMFNMFNEIVNYTNWMKGEPEGRTRDTCAVLTDQGWRLVLCTMTTQALCSRRLRDCRCPCRRMKNRVEITDSVALQAKINYIQRELRIKKRTLSGSLRMKTSANDTRISSVFIGVTSGLIALAFIIGSTVLSDIFLGHWHCKHKKIQ